MLTNNCSTCKKKTLQVISRCSRQEVLKAFPLKERCGVAQKAVSYFKGECKNCGCKFWGVNYR